LVLGVVRVVRQLRHLPALFAPALAAPISAGLLIRHPRTRPEFPAATPAPASLHLATLHLPPPGVQREAGESTADHINKLGQFQ
jgi:hypothetical protein